MADKIHLISMTHIGGLNRNIASKSGEIKTLCGLPIITITKKSLNVKDEKGQSVKDSEGKNFKYDTEDIEKDESIKYTPVVAKATCKACIDKSVKK